MPDSWDGLPPCGSDVIPLRLAVPSDAQALRLLRLEALQDNPAAFAADYELPAHRQWQSGRSGSHHSLRLRRGPSVLLLPAGTWLECAALPQGTGPRQATAPLSGARTSSRNGGGQG